METPKTLAIARTKPAFFVCVFHHLQGDERPDLAFRRGGVPADQSRRVDKADVSTMSLRRVRISPGPARHIRPVIHDVGQPFRVTV